jgi:hypothetical protein
MNAALRGFCLVTVLFVCGCQTVDVTKTAKGFYEPTNPNDVEILMTRPTRPYVELATISTTGWFPSDTAKMHNALRAKSAPVGADAVILANSGIDINGYLWCTGVAVRYTDAARGSSDK